MHLKSRYLTYSVLLGVLVTLGSISSAQAHHSYSHTHRHKHVTHRPVHHKWVVHDVYIVDTRPPIVNTPVTAVAPARCESPSSGPISTVPSNYRTQHKFLVNDDGIATEQSAAPRTPSQQVQLNYYDE